MDTSTRWRSAAIVLPAVLAIACRTAPAEMEPRLIQPGLPGEASHVVDADAVAVDGSRLPHTPADTRFMQQMIVHHLQALVMTELARARAGSDEIRRLALRIELSQDDEIDLMRRWLIERGEAVPGTSPGDGHAHGAGHELMPGMLTEAELAELAAASGTEFDRLFLEMMIRHHEGALTMVYDLLAGPAAAQDVEINDFAAHVEADQSIEIARMRAILQERFRN